MPRPPASPYLLWIDLEMTGLNERVDLILEVAMMITDNDFNVKDTYHQVIFQPQQVLEHMDEWCKKTHGKSGLTDAVKTGILLEKAEKEMCTMVTKYFKKDRAILCGNSVHQDRKFIDEYMKDFAKLLHYRIVDVSSFKEIFQRKYNMEFKKGADTHRALVDVQESIEELKLYLTIVHPPEPKKT